MVSRTEQKKAEKKQARATPAQQRVLDEDQIMDTPQVVAWRLMIDMLTPTTKQLQEWCKGQTADLPSAERKPFPKNQKDFRYNDALMRH